MDDGWWNDNGAIAGSVGAYDAIGAADLAASLVNLRNSGVNDLSPVVAPSWAYGTGWTFTGTEYLDTGLIPASDGSWSAIVRVSGMSGSANRSPYGRSQANRYFEILPCAVAFGSIYRNGDASDGITFITGRTDGVFGMGNGKGFYNGVDEGVTVSPGTGTSLLSVIIGGSNSGSLQQAFVGNIQAIAFYNAALSDANFATISAAMAALPVTPPSGVTFPVLGPGVVGGGPIFGRGVR